MMVVVEELVYDEEGCPVSPVRVDQKGEGAKLPVRGGVLVVERGQDEDQDDLGHTQHYLDNRGAQGWDLQPENDQSWRVNKLRITFLNLGPLSDVIRSSSSDI